MRIISLGLDATDIPRVRQTLERYRERFMQRVFTEQEIAYCVRHRDPAPNFAARFAAKEAAMKALGTGRSQGVLWRDIEVVRRYGPPQLRFHGEAAERFAKLGATRALLSLTHAESLALAQVIFVADEPSARNPR
jgi:holo-[acyl-carrier protein] synthase